MSPSRLHRLALCTLAAAALSTAALATAALGRADRAPASATLPEPVGSLVLLRWGHGALDWLLPHPTGENHDATRR